VVQDLDDLVEAALEFYGEKSLLDSRPLVPSLERDKDSRLVASPLKFPGKLTTDLVNDRLFISDSNHHRIVRKPKLHCAFFFFNTYLLLICEIDSTKPRMVCVVGVDERQWLETRW